MKYYTTRNFKARIMLMERYKMQNGNIHSYKSNNDVAMLEDILNTRTDKIPMCFRKSIKSLKKLRKYVVNSLKYDYTNALVEGKNNKIKVIKRVSYGYRSFRNFKARIMLMERYKIQKGSIHSYKFAMDAAA